MTEAIIAATGFVCAAGGFAFGVRYTAKRVPELLARTSPAQLKAVARRANQLRQQRTAA